MDTTEITLMNGERCAVQGSLHDVEASVLAASRGSIMQFAWLTETPSGALIGINPSYIVSLRALSPADVGSPAG